jgi:hypothetical protein
METWVKERLPTDALQWILRSSVGSVAARLVSFAMRQPVKILRFSVG